jgi:chemotaxis signal transduction protein
MRAEYLKFSVENQQTLLPLTQIQIILRLPKLQVVPNKTKGFEGILNYHGTSVPVYNLGDYIGTVGVPCEVDR